MYKSVFKYLLEITIILLFSPIFVIFFIIIIFYLSFFFKFKEILFIQNRLGRNKKIFKLYKFRTFKKNFFYKNLNYEVVRKKKLLITGGEFIRRFGLDELPQLFQILTGKMSLIGPRPKHPKLMQNYNHRIFTVKPGLIGLSQVIGRNRLNQTFKNKYDQYYAINCSFLLDMRIFFLTFRLFKKKNLYDLYLFKK